MVNIQYKNKLHLLAAVILLCSTARLHYLVLTCDTPLWLSAVCNILFGAYYGFVLHFFVDDIKCVLARRREKRSATKTIPKNAVQNNKL